MEFVPGGTLKQLMRKRQDHGVGFTDEEVATVIRAILEGIKHLHKKGIIHRDLKPGMYCQSNIREHSYGQCW